MCVSNDYRKRGQSSFKLHYKEHMLSQFISHTSFAALITVTTERGRVVVRAFVLCVEDPSFKAPSIFGFAFAHFSPEVVDYLVKILKK